jgi:hypothetical protein
MIDLTKVVLRLARAALPDLLKLVGRFSGWIHNLEVLSRNHAALHALVKKLVRAFTDWISIIGNLGRILGGFFKALLPDGQKMAGNLAEIVKHFADWVNSRQGQVHIRGFFHDIRETVFDIAKYMGSIVKDLDKIAGKAKGVFDFLGSPFKSHHGNDSAFTNAVRGLPGGPVIIQLLGHAKGGVATAPKVGVFGEAGPEALIPLRPDVLGAIGDAIVASTRRLSPVPVGAGGTNVRGDTRIDMPIIAPAGDHNLHHARRLIVDELQELGV